MFTRSILTAVALAAASAHAQLTITSPGPNDWWGTSRNPIVALSAHLLFLFSTSRSIRQHTRLDL